MPIDSVNSYLVPFQDCETYARTTKSDKERFLTGSAVIVGLMSHLVVKIRSIKLLFFRLITIFSIFFLNSLSKIGLGKNDGTAFVLDGKYHVSH